MLVTTLCAFLECSPSLRGRGMGLVGLVEHVVPPQWWTVLFVDSASWGSFSRPTMLVSGGA